jgi:hypothetical protein
VDIPVDWQPSPEDVRFAESRGISTARIADIALKYKNYRETHPTSRRSFRAWIIDERPLRSIEGGKADPLEEKRRRYAASVAAIIGNIPNQGFDQCTG